MLGELQDLQPESGETVSSKEMSLSVESFAEDEGERLRRTYTFTFSDGWDKWMLAEFIEKRSTEVTGGWGESRHLMWHEEDGLDTIDVPPEILEALSEATNNCDITVQVPRKSLGSGFDEVTG